MSPNGPALRVLAFLLCITGAYCSCSLTPLPDDRSIAYVCVSSTLADLEEISAETEWIEFSVSRNLKRIPPDAFRRFSKLRRLTFYNSHIYEIEEHAFRGLNNLRWLIFSGTEILVARKPMFQDLEKLEKLVIDDANLLFIEPQVYEGLTNLQELSLKNNGLDCIDIDGLRHLKYLKTIRIDGNPLMCHCRAKLQRFLYQRNIYFEDGTYHRDVNGYQCMVDVDVPLVNVSLHMSEKLSLNVTEKNYEGGIVETGTITSLDNLPDAVSLIEILGVEIETLPKYAFFRFGNTLRSLELRECSIRAIEEHAFAGLNKLAKLSLTGNQLTTIGNNWFSGLVSLKQLILNENGIEEIKGDVFDNLDNLRYLSLNDNKLKCLRTDIFDRLQYLQRIDLMGNQWNCNCRDILKNYLSQNQIGFGINLNPCTGDNRVGNSTDRWHQDQVELIPRTIGRIYWSSTQRATTVGERLIYTTERPAMIIVHETPKLPPIPATFEPPPVKIPQKPTFKPILRRGRCNQTLTWDSKVAYDCCFLQSIADLNRIPNDVEILRIMRTDISIFPPNYFSRFAGTLKVLHFYKCGIQRIPHDLLRDLCYLEDLSFRENRLKTIEGDVFYSLVNLRTLDLSHNFISTIDHQFYRVLPNLRHLNLEFNELNCISAEKLSKFFRHLTYFAISDNPLSCLCSRKIEEFLIQRNIPYNREYLMKSNNVDGLDCYRNRTTLPVPMITTTTTTSTPMTTTVSIPENEITGTCSVAESPYEVKYRCYGGNIYLLNTIPSNATSIELHDGHVPEIPRNTFLRFPNLRELRIHNCNLKRVEEGAFNGLTKLTTLEIQGNRVHLIPSDCLNLPNLRVLNLRKNYIRVLESGAFQNLTNLEELYLEDNEIQCLFTSELDGLGRLRIVQFVGNQLKWRCRMDLEEYLDYRKVVFTRVTDIKEHERITNCLLLQQCSCEESSGAFTVKISFSTLFVAIFIGLIGFRAA